MALGEPRPSLSFSFIIYEMEKVGVPPKAVPAKRSPNPCALPGWQCGLQTVLLGRSVRTSGKCLSSFIR